MNNKLTKPFGLLTAGIAAISLVGCSTAVDSVDAETAPVAEVQQTIVATTNVWANIAEQIAGDKFDVSALITDASQDPHSFEASARDQLAVSEADLFIVNGGGYDDFAITLAASAGVEPFNVYELHEENPEAEHDHEAEVPEEEHDHEAEMAEEEHDHAHGHDGSDHIWYDFHVVAQTAVLLGEAMTELQPENAEYFATNLEAFQAEMEVIETRLESLSDPSIAYFEAHPLATLMFNELSFVNLTPEGLAEAEEAEVEPSVAILADARDLISSGELSFLAVNSQVTSPTLDQLKELAISEGVPVLQFDELLPLGLSFQEWANSLLDLIEQSIR